MILKRVLKLGLFLQSLRELRVDVDVSDVAIFEVNSKVLKLRVQILDHLRCHLTFEVKNLAQPYRVDERADAFVDFREKQLVETARAQTVHEVFHF